jgi:hypothetical protein
MFIQDFKDKLDKGEAILEDKRNFLTIAGQRWH